MSKTSLLPDNATALETALERTLAKLLDDIPSPFPALWRPADAPSEHLPWLAEALGVTEWDSASSELEKRETLAAQWPNQREAGMGVALRRAISPLGFGVLLKPWYEYGGAPYSFIVEITLNNNPIALSLLNRVQQRINESKSERDTYELAIIVENIDGGVSGAEAAVYAGVVFTDMVTAESSPYPRVYESIPG